MKLVEKGTKYERLQAQQAKAQKRLAQAEQAREKITEELAQALADESPEKTQSLRAQLRALDELPRETGRNYILIPWPGAEVSAAGGDPGPFSYCL